MSPPIVISRIRNNWHHSDISPLNEKRGSLQDIAKRCSVGQKCRFVYFRRKQLSHNLMELGPATNSVQGLHVEGGASRKRARYLALLCKSATPDDAPTALVDCQKILDHLKIQQT